MGKVVYLYRSKDYHPLRTSGDVIPCTDSVIEISIISILAILCVFAWDKIQNLLASLN